MTCARCVANGSFVDLARISEKKLDLQKYDIQGIIYRLDCKICKCFIAIKVNGRILDVNDPCKSKFLNNWQEVHTNRDRLIYYVLCQIIYLEFDTPVAEKLESPYDFADKIDQIFLRWENGKAIGFYTVKPKGTEVFSTKETYTMPVLDTAYIRSQYRGKGFGLEILLDMVKRFPNQDIGFSKPISKGMVRVLKVFLEVQKECRLRFWEIEDYDVTGSQKLIWYSIKNKFL